MTRTRLAAPVLLAIAAASGCGGSNGLSRTELIAKADPICRRANTALDSSKISPRNLATVAPVVAHAEQQASTELARLTPPSSMTTEWKTIVNSFHRASIGLSEAVQAAKSGALTIHSKGLVEGYDQLTSGERARIATAERFGFDDCAKY